MFRRAQTNISTPWFSPLDELAIGPVYAHKSVSTYVQNEHSKNKICCWCEVWTWTTKIQLNFRQYASTKCLTQMRVHSAHNKADGNFLQLCLVLTSLPNLLSTTATKLPQFLPDQRTTILCYGKYTCEKRKRNRLWHYGDNRHTAAYSSVKLASLCICSAVRYSHVKYFWWWPKCANHFPGLPKVDL
jgi:hypothetical protein